MGSYIHAKSLQDNNCDVVGMICYEMIGYLSDQRNYWRFGYPVLMINDTSFVRNPNYYTKKDTIDTLDFDKMTEVINSACKAVTGMMKS